MCCFIKEIGEEDVALPSGEILATINFQPTFKLVHGHSVSTSK